MTYELNWIESERMYIVGSVMTKIKIGWDLEKVMHGADRIFSSSKCSLNIDLFANFFTLTNRSFWWNQHSVWTSYINFKSHFDLTIITNEIHNITR